MSLDTDLTGSERWMATDAYLESHLTVGDAQAARLRGAQKTAGLPDIEVSPMHARLLSILTRISGAATAVEFGTLGGFSALHIARALPPDGRLITIERDALHAQVARESLDAAGVGHKVTIRVGTGLEVMPTLADDAPIDMAFIDADKVNNVAYYEAAVAISRPGAVIVIDNVVRDGAIADPENTDKNVVGARAVIERAASDPRVEATVIQTVGRKYYDGLLIATVL